MRIEGLVTCVGYSDFLSHTLSFNRNIFDHLMVVTSPEDRDTIRTCDFWGVHCVKTDAFRKDKGPFNKAAAINHGLGLLKRDGWVVHLDADIALPPKAKRVLHRLNLDPRCVYGVDRMLCRSFEEWAEFLAAPHPQHELNVFIHPRPFPLGTRVGKDEHGGYLPIGFFQMWNPSVSGIHSYPEGHTDAARSDMLFSLQWQRQHRHLIPDLFAYHLESAPAPLGANWKGRTTPRFVPQACWKPQAAATAPAAGPGYGDKAE